jgi:hypothetical protein
VQEEGDDPTSCPARRNMKTFPGIMVSMLSNDVKLVNIVLTDDLFCSYRCLIVEFVLCHIQKAAKQIIALFYFTRIPASFHHIQHVFLFDARGMNDTCAIGTTLRNKPSAP